MPPVYRVCRAQGHQRAAVLVSHVRVRPSRLSGRPVRCGRPTQRKKQGSGRCRAVYRTRGTTRRNPRTGSRPARNICGGSTRSSPRRLRPEQA
jgi:hypothetical protein